MAVEGGVSIVRNRRQRMGYVSFMGRAVIIRVVVINDPSVKRDCVSNMEVERSASIVIDKPGGMVCARHMDPGVIIQVAVPIILMDMGCAKLMDEIRQKCRGRVSR